MFDVYCHTNKFDLKRYIGFSQLGIEKRWRGHIASARLNSQHYFHRAIRLHGKEQFEHTLLEQCDTIEAAREAEIWWIGHFCSDDPRFGYNMTSGGEGCPDLTEEAQIRKSEKLRAWYAEHPERRQQISETCSENNRKRVHTIATRAKFSKLHRGRKLSEETRRKMSESAKRRWERKKFNEEA